MGGHSRQGELREHALNMLASAVAYFDGVGIDPDTWQGSNLAQAFSEMTRGCYGLAAKSVGEAMLPAHERPIGKHPNDCGAIDRRLLGSLLENARAEPVRKHPHHGPITYEENAVRPME